MVDSNCNHFVLLSRLQQAEALIEKRKQDLENHQKRCLQLELTYVQDKELTVREQATQFVGCFLCMFAARKQLVCGLHFLWRCLQSYAAQELAGVREQLNADNRQAIQLKRDIATAQQELVATLDTARHACAMRHLQLFASGG